MSYTYEKYVCTADEVRDTVKKYGVAIVPNVLNQKEIKAMQDGAWNTLEHVTQKFDTPIKRADEKSWLSFKYLYALHSMLIQHHGVGHAQFVWDLRQNPKIIKIFSDIWGTNNLLTSFDGISFHLPPEKTNRGYYRGNAWFHTDQSYTRPDFECIQSWVTAYDVNEGDATLCFLENSNNYSSKFGKQFNVTDTSNWYKLNEDEKDFYINDCKCEPKCIKCPTGSMVFWDSRTIHCGKESDKNRAKSNFRCVVYICMMPKEGVDSKVLQNRKKAFDEKRLTSHWPNRFKLFPKTPRTYGGQVQEITALPDPVLTDLGKNLIC